MTRDRLDQYLALKKETAHLNFDRIRQNEPNRWNIVIIGIVEGNELRMEDN